MPLNFNFMLDNELRVPIGQLPGGINTQAVEMAASQMTRRFRETQQMLSRKAPGIGASPYSGMTPAWQMRLKAESAWVAALLDRISDVAQQVADSSNAEVQGSMRELWNRWAPEVLKVYSQTLRAYQKDVGFAMSNQAVTGAPPIYAKMAHLLKTDAPDLNPVALSNGLSGAFTDDDAAYLADLELNVFGREVPDSAVALGIAGLAGAWWWFGRKPAPALGGFAVKRCTKYRTYNGKRRCVSYLPRGTRTGRKIRCAKYRIYSNGKRHCIQRQYV